MRRLVMPVFAGWLLANTAQVLAQVPSVEARLKQLEDRMYKHARDLEFEDAARVRDQIRKLKDASLAT